MVVVTADPAAAAMRPRHGAGLLSDGAQEGGIRAPSRRGQRGGKK